MYQTKKQTQERIAEIEVRLGELRLGKYMNQTDSGLSEKISYFSQNYWKIPEYEKQRIQADWDEYYKSCAESTENELFKAMRKAFKEKNMVRFKELQKQARQMLKNGISEINKPSGYDPMWWDMSDIGNQYKSLSIELDRLKKTVGNTETYQTNVW